MRHAGSKTSEHGVFFLLREMRRERLAIADRPRHRIEAVEELPKFAANFLAVSLRNRLDAPFADPFDMTCKYAKGLKHMLHGKVADQAKMREPSRR